MVVMRHPNPGAAMFLSKHVDASIVNAGDGAHEHPTQALLDCFSIQEKLGDIAGKKVVIVGDILHSRVALSNIFALKKLGAEVMVCGPLTLIPKHIESLGVTVETNLQKALQWADVANVLRVQFERMRASFFPSNREYAMQYGISKQLVEQLDNELLIMINSSLSSCSTSCLLIPYCIAYSRFEGKKLALIRSNCTRNTLATSAHCNAF